MTKKKSEKTEEKKVSEETVAEETKTENTEEPAKDENADKIKALEDELSAQKDKYMRLAAEYDNYRKRTANEKLSIYDDATSKACIELLPVADSVTLALANLKDADPDIIKCSELLSNRFQRALKSSRLSPKAKQAMHSIRTCTMRFQRLRTKTSVPTQSQPFIRRVTKSVTKLSVTQWYRLPTVTDFIYKYSAENTQTKTIKNSIGGIYHG